MARDSYSYLHYPMAYLLGHVAFRYRHVHTVNWRRLILALFLLALMPLAVELRP